jgi:hypothetical protein
MFSRGDKGSRIGRIRKKVHWLLHYRRDSLIHLSELRKIIALLYAIYAFWYIADMSNKAILFLGLPFFPTEGEKLNAFVIYLGLFGMEDFFLFLFFFL